MRALPFKMRTLAQAEQAHLGHALLLPSLVSLLLALLAAILAGGGVSSWTPLWVAVSVQGGVLALCGAGVAAVQAASLNRWQRRVAPAQAQLRVRQALLSVAWQAAARGLAGPGLVALTLAWAQPDGLVALAVVLPAVMALLLAALLAGMLLGLGWQGRAPRWCWAAGLAVATLGGMAYEIGPLMAARPAASVLLLLATAALAWRQLIAPDALQPRSAAWSAPRLWPALRKRLGSPPWQAVPFPGMSGATGASVLWVPYVMLGMQGLTQSRYLYLLAWSKPMTAEAAPLGYGLLLAMLSLFAGLALIAPSLHWRRLLAPGGRRAQRWAVELVLASCISLMLVLSLLVAARLLISEPALRWRELSAWLPLMGDAVLAMTWAAWIRGWRNRRLLAFLASLVLGLAGGLVLWVLQQLGVTPQRGVLWLLIQLGLSLVFATLAVRAWARQDLNALAQR